MSRDDDDYDDRPHGSPRRGRDRAVAPGLVLAILAGTSIVLGSLGLVNHVTGLDGQHLRLRAQLEAAEAMPPGPQRDAQVKMTHLIQKIVTPMIVAILVPSLLLNALAVAGGLRLRVARNYPLAMAGTICAVIPCGALCVVTTPAGIWALVTLLDVDVKVAFAANRRRPQ